MPQRWRLPLAAVLLAWPAVADRESAVAPLVAQMKAEALEETSPGSLRMAGGMLGKGFNRGVDDLDGYAYLQKLLIQHALGLAERNPDQATEYKSAAIPMAYNLAAHTWIGWGAGQVGAVEAHHRRLGLEAARLNIKLAAEVGLGPERRRNGYWMLGAQQLAAGDYDAAAQSFRASAALGAESDDEAATSMAQGWVHVARILAGQDESGDLDAVTAKLRTLGEDGVFYAGQYAVALDALRSASPR